MERIRFTRSVLTATVGQVHAGDEAEVTTTDAERYVRNGWAEKITPPKPRKRAAR